MPKRPTLSVETIKLILLAKVSYEQAKFTGLTIVVNQQLGRKPEEKDLRLAAVQDKMADYTCDLAARRLKRNRPSVELISLKDLDLLIPELTKEMLKSASSDEVDPEAIAAFEQFGKELLRNGHEAIKQAFDQSQDPYERCWRWVHSVVDLASEEGINPTELLTLPGKYAEATRRTYTKAEFIKASKERCESIVNPALVANTVKGPLLNLVATLGEEECEAFKQEFETRIMPELRSRCELAKPIVKAWLSSEADEIYPPRGKKRKQLSLNVP